MTKCNCTANFVAEQLERLKNMTDEERLKLLQTLFPSAVDVNEVTIHYKPYPSAEAEWIPCSERLPKEYAQYLVCFKSGECYVYWLEDSDWARGMAEKDGILAWMPLPKPYRGEQTDSNT